MDPGGTGYRDRRTLRRKEGPRQMTNSDPPPQPQPGMPTDGVEHPGKVIRIASMTHQLLDEVRQISLDESGRERLMEVYRTTVEELADSLDEGLRDELGRLALPFGDDGTPSQDELRLAQAQLQGWLQGVFQGIQATIAAQQMAAQAQLAEMRRGPQPLGPGDRDRPDRSSSAYL